jgi:hypothetical protein
VPETTPGQSDRAARGLTTARLYLNLPPEVSKKWSQINANLNDYHCGPTEISSTFWRADMTDWWHQQEETHSTYADLSNVPHDIISVIPCDVRVVASISHGRDVIGWRQSKPTGESIAEEELLRQFAQPNPGILPGAQPDLVTRNTEYNSEMNEVADERKFPRMAKVHHCLEMCLGSQTYVQP